MQHFSDEDKMEMEQVLVSILTTLPLETRLAVLSPEERLAGLSPEVRLAGLSPEERLRGLSPEELGRLWRLLHPAPPEASDPPHYVAVSSGHGVPGGDS